MEPQKDMLQDELFHLKRRRSLLPWWMKVFVWIFLISGVAVPIAIILASLHRNVQLSLYGFETTNPFSLTGILILSVFVLKTIVSYGLWFEKKWAINLGVSDAVIGLIACLFIMVFPLIDPSAGKVIFRIEILFLALYLWQLQKIKTRWIFTTPETSY